MTLGLKVFVTLLVLSQVLAWLILGLPTPMEIPGLWMSNKPWDRFGFVFMEVMAFAASFLIALMAQDDE